METPVKSVAGADKERSFLQSQDPHLRDIRLAIEYKSLIKNAPGGVYLLPHSSNIRQFFGVIFLRKGYFRGGAFRFVVELPEEYNSEGSFPTVSFTPPVFHPLVHPETGEVHLHCSDKFKTWNPNTHFLTTLLVFLKKMFYFKSFDQFHDVPNEEALELFNHSPAEFLERVQENIDHASENLHRTPPECPIVFTEPKTAHQALREQIFGATAQQREAKRRSVVMGPHVGFLSPSTPATLKSEIESALGGKQAAFQEASKSGQNLAAEFGNEN